MCPSASQQAWIDKKLGKRLSDREEGGLSGGIVVDWKEDPYQMGVYFIVEMRDGSHNEIYREYPLMLNPKKDRMRGAG